MENELNTLGFIKSIAVYAGYIVLGLLVLVSIVVLVLYLIKKKWGSPPRRPKQLL